MAIHPRPTLPAANQRLPEASVPGSPWTNANSVGASASSFNTEESV